MLATKGFLYLKSVNGIDSYLHYWRDVSIYSLTVTMSVSVFGNNCLKKHHKWKQWQLFRAVKRTHRTFVIPRISCRTQDTQDNIVKQQEISVGILQSSLVSFFRRWVDNLLVCLWKPAEMYREDHQKYHTIIKLKCCIKVYPPKYNS